MRAVGSGVSCDPEGHVVVVVVLLPPLREPGQMEVLTRQGRTRGLSGPDELVGANRRPPGGMDGWL